MTQNTTDTSRRRYEFNTRLGVGGFGEVYRATMHTGAVHMDVAVKLLRPEYGQDEQAGLRLRDEARFLSALRHPSIIRIFDLVKLHGRLALVTEFADGEDLKRVLEREDPLPPRAAAEILARVADALHAASTSLAPGSSSPMKLIHRDIKPGNIHLGSHGGVTLLDFGIARTDAVGRQARTAAYAIVGSGEYTPPEILMREPATEASDIWSLGVTIFEALSGTSLFEDPDMRSMARLFVKGQPRALIESRIGALDAPPALHQLLLDMLEIDPEDRPAATDVMRRADDLVDNLDGLSLRRWAQQRTWLPPAAEPGALEGSTLIEEPLDATASQMPKATPPFAPQRGSFDAVDHDDEDVEDEETEETFSPASPIATVSFPSDFEDSDDEARTVVHDPNAPQFDDEAAVVDDDPTLPKPPRTQPEDESEAVLVPPPAPARTQQSQGRGWWLAALLLVLIFGGLVGVTGLAGSGLLLMAPGTSSTEVVEPPENPGAAAVDAPEPGTAPERNDEAEPGEPAGEPVAHDTPELDASDAAGADDQPDGGTETEDLPEAAAAPKPTEAPAPAVAPTAAPPTAPAPRPAPSPAPQPSQAPPTAPAPAPTYSTRPEAMDYAKLTFNANVKAEVYVDGKLEGTTPVTVTLTPGRHEFYAMIPGYPQTKTGGPINLVAGSNQQLNLTFQKN